MNLELNLALSLLYFCVCCTVLILGGWDGWLLFIVLSSTIGPAADLLLTPAASLAVKAPPLFDGLDGFVPLLQFTVA
jgi:hypothetical protein